MWMVGILFRVRKWFELGFVRLFVLFLHYHCKKDLIAKRM